MITKEKSLSIEILNAVVLSFSLRRAVRQRQGHVNTPIKTNLKQNCLEAGLQAETSFKYYSPLVII